MKKVLFLISILILVLLAGCGSREAKEPVPEWPERLTGEYDASLTFTFMGAEPVSAGQDTLTGRMTALFSLEDGGTLALGWRRLAGAETELLEDFLAGGGTAGAWSADTSAPSAAESYVSLEGRWYCITASCPGKDVQAVIDLVDGTVEAKTAKETALPGAASAFLSDLPWEEEWTCLMLGYSELDPETGKEALHTLFGSYDWELTQVSAEEAEPVPGKDLSVIPLARRTLIWVGEDGPLSFHLRRNGDVWYRGALWSPLGEGAGEQLLADFEALRDSGVPTESPPPLTYSCGEETLEAVVHPSYSWRYVTRAGDQWGAESDADLFEYTDWLDGTYPVLRAEGDVVLTFSGREPDSPLTLGVFTDLGKAPVELRDHTFTPYAGLNAYFLRVGWKKAEWGGYGGAVYILLIDGACAGTLPETEAKVSVSLLEADAYGCSFTLENRGGRQFALFPLWNTGLYPLFRQTEFGGWEWVKPIWTPENGDWSCKTGNTLTMGLDWSRELGTLEPGRYALLLSGSFQDRKGYVGDTVYLPLHFTLGEDSLSEPPGPLALQRPLKGLTLELTRLSTRRYMQTITVEGEGSYIPERDFTLFRVEENGERTYIPPRYHLPYSLNHPFLQARASSPAELEIDLAAQYGALTPGQYVVRRRLYRLEEDETFSADHPFDRSWRTLPEDRILCVDTAFSLTGSRYGLPDSPIAAAAREVEPQALPYAGEDPKLRVIIQDGHFTSGECRFSILNREEEAVSFDPERYALFYLERNGEWLPLAQRRHFGSGAVLFPLEPGESRGWRTEFGKAWQYDVLPQGAYRLVFMARLGEDRENEYPLVVEFSIKQDGTGSYTGMEREVKAAMRAYQARLAAAYVLPEFPEDAPPFTIYRSFNQYDPYTQEWEFDIVRDRGRVTVFRDRDVARAQALLADFPTLEVVRGENVQPHSSTLNNRNMGTLGTLRAELVPQTDPELCREGTWLLTLEVTAEETVWRSPGWVQKFFVEVWDREAEEWATLSILNWFYLAVGHSPVPMEPGMELWALLSLGWFHTEFSPEEEYRFVLESDAGPGNDRWVFEYYTCPFSITEAGQA